MRRKAKSEPTVIAHTTAAILNAVQLAAVPMPVWAHVLVLVGVQLLAGTANRGQVTPK